MPLSLSRSLVAAFFLMLFATACSKKREGKPRVLVFTKTAGFVHESIPEGVAAIQKLGAANGFDVDTTSSADFFAVDTLRRYAAVIFLNTTGDVLNGRQENAFERYIQAGGGFVGVHSATDTEYDWGWYGRLVGGYFNGHPHQQNATLNVVDDAHQATKGLPKEWKRFDEWYNFKKLNPDAKVLINIDEKSYQGGTNGNAHPMAWYHDFEGGRAFYTGLGHTKESYTEQNFLNHLLGGIQYAIGDNHELDIAAAKTLEIPDEDRFVKTTLTQGEFFEPTEMAILPNLDVLVAQRRGELMLYNGKDKSVKEVGRLDVYHKATVPNVNAEEGLMGLTLDPEYKQNNFIYLFYSPMDTSVNRLSRFVFKDGKFDPASEKVVLQFYSQRNICCHTGGSVTFGKDNLLYLSTGDNSTPFDEPGQAYVNHGFAPLDDRPGHEQYDARRTSSNSADLRGKILRIRIKDDGSYEIPEGNLFPNNPKARPEIFTMGHRNPYRISVDKHSGFLYWGEVGPDAARDSLDTRGPRGYDEVNQAKKAGYYGWPLFIGNNYAYKQYDYASGTAGNNFDAAQPMNVSRNNTGLQQLPQTTPAFIWYPYDVSPDFPQVGTGGRNAMAGPIYYAEDFPKETRLPDYYDKKFFIYDWIRGWMKAVTLTDSGDFDKMEAFMPGTRFNAPIDMEVAPDGRLYVLEYGSGWFSKNPDAGLSRIDYIAGNRPAKVASLNVDKTSGNLPYTFTATIDAKDPEGDKLRYIWTVGGEKKETTEPKLTHTISKAGEYPLSVEVLDEAKASAKSATISVFAGNAQPAVAIALQDNPSFYFGTKPVAYAISVRDEGDSLRNQNLYVSTEYIRGYDQAEVTQGHQQVSAAILGRSLTQSLDCKTCHKEAERSIGPAYTAVAERYKDKEGSSDYLVRKIITGGAGVWGEVAMPAHTNLKESDVRQMVEYIKGLAGNKAKKSLPAKGAVTPAAGGDGKGATVLVLRATYTDEGGGAALPLSGTNAVYLRSNVIKPTDANGANSFETLDSAGRTYGVMPWGTGWIKVAHVSLQGLSAVELSGISRGDATYAVELHTGSPSGPVVGTAAMNFAGRSSATTRMPLKASSAQPQDLYFVFRPAGGITQRPLLSSLQFLQ